MDHCRATYNYRSHAPAQTALRMRLKELASDRPRFGYRRLHLMLRREGWPINHKRVLRIYRQEGLLVRTKRRRSRIGQPREWAPPATSRPNERWCLDFMWDQMSNRRRFRVLTVIDAHTRESLGISVALTFPSKRVTEVLDQIISKRGTPGSLSMDNGTEFTSICFDSWAYQRKIKQDFITPGRPSENGLIESFNGRFRDECLNQHWFVSLDDARKTIDGWREDYNQNRPHSSLGDLTPNEFVAKLLQESAG